MQTELHDYTGEEKGRALGMPLGEFCDTAYADLSEGSDPIVIGSIGPQEQFLDIVNKRRSVFEFLAKMMGSH